MTKASVLVWFMVLSKICRPGLDLAAPSLCTEVGALQFIFARPDFGGCTICVGGPLRVCDGTVWKALCDKEWTLQDAAVACKTLGYSPAGRPCCMKRTF